MKCARLSGLLIAAVLFDAPLAGRAQNATPVPAPAPPAPAAPQPPPQPAQPPQPPLGNEIRQRDFFNAAQTALDCRRLLESGNPNQKTAAQIVLHALNGEWNAAGELLRAHSDKPQASDAYSALLEKLAQTSQLPKFKPESRNMYFGESPERYDRERPHLLVAQDLMDLLSAAPGPLGPNDLAAIVKIGKVALNDTDKSRLAAALQTGLGGLGGAQPEARAHAASILTALGQPALAKPFLPVEAEAENPALSVTQLIALIEYHGALLELGLPEGSHAKAAALCAALSKRIPAQDLTTRAQLAQKLRPLVNAMEAGDAEAFLKAQVLPQPALANAYVTHLMENAAAALKSPQEKVRTDSLLAQMRFLNAWGTVPDPLPSHLAALVLTWTDEAETALRFTPDRKESEDGRQAIAEIYGFSDRPAQFLSLSRAALLEHGPSEAVLEKLGSALAQRARFLRLRLQLGDPGAGTLGELRSYIARNPESKGQLCSDYLAGWTKQRATAEEDPEVVRMRARGFPIPKISAQIPLTRARQVQYLREFSTLLKELRTLSGNTLKPEAEVRAFAAIHSPAEVFSREDITTAFGPAEAMVPETVAALSNALRRNLATQWDDPGVQQQQATNRTRAEMREEVRAGYQLAADLVRHNLAKRDAEWTVFQTAALTLFDAAEYEFKEKGPLESYIQSRAEALAMFRRAAEAYNKTVPGLPQRQWTLDAYLPWISAMLGATDLTRLKWKEGRPEPTFEVIAQTLNALPKEAAAKHRADLAKLAESLLPKVAPAMRQKFLTAIAQTAGTDLSEMAGINRVLQGYQQLTAETRLRATVDGSTEVSTKQAFGVALVLEYTAQLGRETNGFSKYLQNPGAAASANPFFASRNAKPPPNYRDEFQKNIRTALGSTFEILGIAFHSPNIAPLATERPGWNATPLAYLILRPKDEAVDRLPGIQIDLEFAEGSQQVILPIASQIEPLQNKATPTAARPAPNLGVTVTVDERDWQAKQRLQIEVDAKAEGVVPEFQELFDFAADGFEVRVTDPGASVDEFKTEQNQTKAVVSRSWQLLLTPASSAKAPDRVVPPVLRAGHTAEMVYRIYKDADLVTLTSEAAAKGVPLAVGGARWALPAGAVLLALAGGALGLRALRKRGTLAPEVDPLPAHVTPFSTLRFLNRCLGLSSVREAERAALLRDIQALETRCFGRGATPPEEAELRPLLERYRELAQR